jgi:hypothetical protein
MNQLRRVQGLAYPTQASRSADVKTGEIAGKEPGVPRKWGKAFWIDSNRPAIRRIGRSCMENDRPLRVALDFSTNLSDSLLQLARRTSLSNGHVPSE